MIPEALTKYLKHILNINSSLINFKSLSGGCINRCFSFQAEKETYFLKLNTKEEFPDMFSKEAIGLQLLSETNTIIVPKTIAEGFYNDTSFLILEHIEEGAKTPLFWEKFGQQLAQLHKTEYSSFGLHQDNYIGSIPQKNDFKDNWVDFFIECRLYPLSKQAYEKGLLNIEHLEAFIELYRELPSLLPKEKPSLVHGDLWSGNFLCNTKGNPVLIDPAIYYGNREMEIAFTKLFGGFDSKFYSSYQEAFPLETGFTERVDIYNLYPLLVHLLLFGKSYLGQIEATLIQFD